MNEIERQNELIALATILVDLALNKSVREQVKNKLGEQHE